MRQVTIRPEVKPDSVVLGCRCPVAIELNRVSGQSFVWVGIWSATFFGIGGPIGSVILPGDLTTWIMQYVDGKKPEPQDFTMEIP